MIRKKYELTLSSYPLKRLLSNKRWNRGVKFYPLQSIRDQVISDHKRVNNWNKHTMGTE